MLATYNSYLRVSRLKGREVLFFSERRISNCIFLLMMLNLSFVVGHALSIRNHIIGGFKSSKLIIVAANSY